MELELVIKGTPEELQGAITKLTGAPSAEPWFQTHSIPLPGDPGPGGICRSCGREFDKQGTRARFCDECKKRKNREY